MLFINDGSLCPDGFFYARYAQRLPEFGLQREFPWLQFTALKHSYFDNHFLYNVFLVPFCRFFSEPLDGLKYATLLLELSLLVVFYVVLGKLRIRWPLFWVALLAVGSPLFLFRFLMPRSHVLSSTLMVLVAYAVLRRRFWAGFALGFIYVWSYSAPVVALCTALAAELTAFVLARPAKRPFAMTAAVGLGLCAGHLIHPYTPLTINALYSLLNVVQAAATQRAALDMAGELRPLGCVEALLVLPPICLALLGALVGAAVLRFRDKTRTGLSTEAALALGPACGWFAGIFIFHRVVDYAAPLVLLAAALVLRDWKESAAPAPTNFKQGSVRRWYLPAAAIVFCTLLNFWSFEVLYVKYINLQYRLHWSPSGQIWARGRYFEGTAAWLKAHVPPKTIVLNFDWDDFPELYYLAPEFYYVSGTDPTALRAEHPELFDVLQQMRDGSQPLDLPRLRQAFGVDYLVMRSLRAASFPELRESGIKPVYLDEGGTLYDLRTCGPAALP